MAQLDSRLCVHIMFDIDHTLLSYVPARLAGVPALPAGLWSPTLSAAPPRGRAAPLEAAECVWYTTLAYEAPPLHRHTIALRPHVAPFLRRLLRDRALDTDRVRVDVSLWTRRPKSYAEAVAAQALEPLIARAGGAAGGGAPLLRGTHGGEMCSNKEEHTAAGAAGAASGVMCHAGGHSGWKKSVGAHPGPFTTLLVDDTSENFVPWECRTGHCVHVPSFRPALPLAEADLAASDRLFLSPAEKSADDDARFVEQCLSCEGDPSCPSGDGTLLPLVQSFVDTCHRHADTLRGLSAPPASAPCRTDAATSAFLQQFNFFERSGAYREAWEHFHRQEGTGDALEPFFYC
ncbi:hypothetical protein STCU_05849 [Strigomonas culicis]|uniref:FCP1 homology domain-containing protein n=1 Tax=Strigomonas culicis TaxID=28005 RepID=S9U909_9TRYP|nr:hypothetical protein STCU_05849 [Strigomonas culicis]|eukprot:EPY27242.1 hypothetical protein STCU_05849 [Strigomonas culicis]